MGRQTKFTKERRDKIVDLMRAGNYLETAARASGVAPNTVYRWMTFGDPDFDPTTWNEETTHAKVPKDLAPYRTFRDAVTRAEAEAEAVAVAVIRRSAVKDGDWKAAEAYLKRRHPTRFGDRNRIDANVKADVGGPVAAALEDFAAMLDDLASDAADNDTQAHDETKKDET